MDGYCRYLLVSYGWCALNGREGVEKVGACMALDLACWHGAEALCSFRDFLCLKMSKQCVWVR